VYNEVEHVNGVLDEVLRYSPNVLVVDDGSTDGTADVLAKRHDVQVIRHARNTGYGGALATAFDYACRNKFDTLVTIDCDGQHQPRRIPEFVAAAQHADVVSGSRYLKPSSEDTPPPPERMRVNQQITESINQRLHFKLTDAFCGFKAYSRRALCHFHISELGYAMPLEVWVQAKYEGLSIMELPVPLIYLDLSRSFGGSLDDAAIRLEYYHLTLNRCIAEAEAKRGKQGCGCSGGRVVK
jgi:dolichol-phosphate mannosyltransferase